ncbi:hypothetical protein BD410DRAFT_837570 [Rickenella mellea]|uniref:SET domain-containing protein n=1 Tax=Rickenella mellea TaxID=50990 RepID=A0A4Y7QDV6_9AGAM|nr:hypothetical protein BD410DRAFT_837570 [Rickenella mellea]
MGSTQFKTGHDGVIAFDIDDVEGSVAQLQICHFPAIGFSNVEELDVIFPPGVILAVRKPTCQLSVDNVKFIQADSLSVIFLEPGYGDVNRQSWARGKILTRSPVSTSSVDAWRVSGAAHFRAKRWLAAAVYFSNGLELDPDAFVLRLNRSEAYIRMGWYRSAFHDAEKVLLEGHNIEDTLIRKAIFRAAKSLYHLGRYNEAIEIANRRPHDEDCQIWGVKASERLREQLSGQYDWSSLFRETHSATGHVEMAEFTGPIQVRGIKNVGGGRGVFVTRDVKAGELLIVSKSIASGSARRESEQVGANVAVVSAKTRLIERLWDDPSLQFTINTLYAGTKSSPPNPYPPSPSLDSLKSLEHPLRPSPDIDITRAGAIYSSNAHRIVPFPSASHQSKAEMRRLQKEDPHCGLFLLPSLCNHSCLPSACWLFFGDFMCVRASQNLREGEEVTVQYFLAHRLAYEERQRMALQWGFRCHCILCEADTVDGQKICEDRENIVSQINQESSKDDSDPALRKASKFVDNARRTYRDHEKRRQCNFKPALYEAHGHLSVIQIKRDWKSSLREGMKALEAVGIIVLDNSLVGKAKCKSSLPINVKRTTQWNDQCVLLALRIAYTFKNQNDMQRAELWLKSAVYLEDIRFGGGWPLFEQRYSEVIEIRKLGDLARRVLS